MGDRQERSGGGNSQHIDADEGFLARVWGTLLKPGQPGSLIPVHVYTSQEFRRSSAQPVLFWQLCKAWVRYHSIQMRWDIERSLAHLLHRRWV
jgi:hypothetical protein